MLQFWRLSTSTPGCLWGTLGAVVVSNWKCKLTIGNRNSLRSKPIQFCHLIECLCFNFPSMESKQRNFCCQNQQRCAEESILPRWQHAADIWPSSWSKKTVTKKHGAETGCKLDAAEMLSHPNLFKLIPIVLTHHPRVNWYIHGSESVYQSDHKLGHTAVVKSPIWGVRILSHFAIAAACTHPFHGPTWVSGVQTQRVASSMATAPSSRRGGWGSMLDVLKNHWSPTRWHLPPCSRHVLLCDIFRNVIHHAFDTWPSTLDLGVHQN